MTFLARYTMTKEKLFKIVPEFKRYSDEVIEQILIEAKYNRYIQKQKAQVDRMRDMLQVKIPSDFDFSKVSGLSNEIVEKLHNNSATNPI